MKSEHPARRRRPGRVGPFALALLLACVAGAEPTPTTTPTPTPASGKKSLAEAARAINSQPTPARTSIVITNETVAANAGKGRVTTAKPSTDSAPAPVTAAADVDPKREQWRQTYQDQLQVIAVIEAEIAALDLEIPKLWSDFYAWDDPAYRDGVIKTSLDAAMARRDELRKQLTVEKEKPAKIIAEARRDGALPGWFRDLK